MSKNMRQLIKLPFGFFVGRASDAAAQVSGAPEERAVLERQAMLRLAGAAPSSAGQGGRKTVETLDKWSKATELWAGVNKRKYYAALAMASKFDTDKFLALDIDQLTEILADVSPEISKALWDFQLMCNSGFEVTATKPATEELDERAQAALQLMLDKLAKYNGTLGVFFDRMFNMLFLRGAYCAELVLAKNGREFVDIALPDVRTLEFRRAEDELRGQHWVYGQRVNGVFNELSKYDTVAYIPIHPKPDSIEGTALCTSAVFLAVFLMAVLRDVKRVVQHQGYLRLDVEVVFEKLRDAMPEDMQSNPAAAAKWMDDVVAEVTKVYESLEPDDTYIHSDAVKVNNPVGTVSADSLEALDALFKALERMAVRALKTMPLLLGATEGTSEANANRQWEIYAKGIESIQHLVEEGMESLLTLALQAQGIQAEVEVRFAVFRAAEALRDKQIDILTLKYADGLYDSGLISQDEKAKMVLGKEAADAPEPRKSSKPVTGFGNEGTVNPNEGEARGLITSALQRVLQRAPTFGELDAAEAFLRDYAPEALTDLYEADVIDETAQ